MSRSILPSTRHRIGTTVPKRTPEEMLDTKFGKISLRDWDLRWEPLANPFSESHPELRHVVGLFRAVLDGETMYVVCASETKGGIAKGLRRISGPNQTGNSGYGARMIRKHLDQVTVDILRVSDEQDSFKVTKLLKKAMVKRYDPDWAKPYKQRMAEIRAGTRSPD